MKQRAVFVGGKRKRLVLEEADFAARGGEGAVFFLGELAYKIYHEPQRMPPEKKLAALGRLNLPNVVAPADLVYDADARPIGFSMRRVPNAEYLSRLFSRTFRRERGLDGKATAEIVDKMRRTLTAMHSHQVIVADYNELNVLLDLTALEPYNIDLDSCQTPEFPATAIMDNVRDRASPPGVFNEDTDWFSWAIVSFQLFTGVHPFKGKHPDFRADELDRRMTEGVSVLDPAVRVPPACSDWSEIPATLLDWYRAVFANRLRGAPPDFLQRANAVYAPVRAQRAAGVLEPPIIGGGRARILCDGDVLRFCEADTGAPVAGELRADGYFVVNDALYSLRNGVLTECVFERLGRVVFLTRIAAHVHPLTGRAYDGLVMETFLDRAAALLPVARGSCKRVMIPEVAGTRIIDAARRDRAIFLLAEQAGAFNRFTLRFSADYSTYECSIERDVAERAALFEPVSAIGP